MAAHVVADPGGDDVCCLIAVGAARVFDEGPSLPRSIQRHLGLTIVVVRVAGPDVLERDRTRHRRHLGRRPSALVRRHPAVDGGLDGGLIRRGIAHMHHGSIPDDRVLIDALRWVLPGARVGGCFRRSRWPPGRPAFAHVLRAAARCWSSCRRPLPKRNSRSRPAQGGSRSRQPAGVISVRCQRLILSKPPSESPGPPGDGS